MIRLYTNENFPKETVIALRTLGYDVLTVQEAGNAHQRIPDDEVLAFARQTKRILITINRKDFMLLHKKLHGNHSGIIVCTEDIDFKRLAGNIDKVLRDFFRSAATLDGQLLKVYKG